jgi:hypothetical protein
VQAEAIVTPDTEVDAFFRDAMSLQSRGERAQAIELYRQILARRGDHPDALNNLGVLLEELGAAHEARSLLERAVRAAPQATAPRFNLARTLIDIGDPGEAARMLEALADDAPDDADVCLALGVAFDRLGRLAEAQEWYHEAAVLAQQFRRGKMTRFGRAFFEELETAPPPMPAAPETVWTDGPAEAVERVVLAAADTSYLLRFAAAFVHSLAACRSPGTLVHLHAVDAEAGLAERLQRLVDRIGSCPVRFSQERMPRLRAEPKVYYASARFVHLPAWLASYGVPILVSDVDVVFQADPAAVFTAMAGHELGIFHRPLEKAPWLDLCACALVAVPCPATLNYAVVTSAYLRRFLLTYGAEVGLDQVAPHCVLRELSVAGTAPAWLSIRGASEDTMWFIGGRRGELLGDPRFVRFNLPL